MGRGRRHPYRQQANHKVENGLLVGKISASRVTSRRKSTGRSISRADPSPGRRQLLNRAIAEADISRERVYLSNAEKHFKFEQRGKRRIHPRPTAGRVKHCRWWLLKELEFVEPRIAVALGTTAVLALGGKALPISRNRGEARFEK